MGLTCPSSVAAERVIPEAEPVVTRGGPGNVVVVVEVVDVVVEVVVVVVVDVVVEVVVVGGSCVVND